MNFRHRSGEKSEPEINLVPLIDVMLVIIIFLMLTTTFDKIAGMEVALPTADASSASAPVSEEIVVGVAATGDVQINGRRVNGGDVGAIGSVLVSARPAKGREPVVVINADAQAAHQTVINVMQAAQNAGLTHVTFATRQESRR
ncbi:MAG: biopolymer transporter ExbD [Azoarcus sp.]|jgi:biopolymer transport protein ExbD|nr:biopolymer transporter ExbD [Azoarcus sp.]